MTVRYVSVEEVLFLHDLVLRETGGAHGIRDLSLLQAAVERPKAQFGGADLYPVVESKAAALVHSLVKSHPFVDGNKRTAAAALIRFLDLNVVQHRVTSDQLYRLIMRIAKRETITSARIARWIRTARRRRTRSSHA